MLQEVALLRGKIAILPLTTTHPTIFQHRWVRTSTWCYPSFILAMVRSPGFGSIRCDSWRPVKTCFRFGSGKLLNLATPYKSPAHSSTGTRSGLKPLPLLVRLRFHVLFHSPSGVLFHLSLAVLLHYRSLRSI